MKEEPMDHVNYIDGDPRNNDLDNLEIVESDDSEEDEEEEFDPNSWFALKWLADGATDLSQVAAALRAEADRLEALGRDGWRLVDEVDNGQGMLERKVTAQT